ncbi:MULTISPECIES: hypothetical protein [unclassified Crossiella]|uniref:hypothetical protein n=1 Tax=unclassified Crossiella TaxID=2620835 RepID=UPI001FFE9590|nr:MULTISPECIES: hypothetical protein [unclassified Crossiella]MCK2239404.1 hypothetical protein [Crossiella sp. S99.2]MCK2252099.1 hypothetical protein [Crossiella sp. S99.1]
MQMPEDTALAAATHGAVRTPLVRLRADWDRDGRYAHPLADLTEVTESVTVDRSLTGDLPAECRLVEGYTTARLSATLAGARNGDPRDIARLLSPYRRDSPLHARPREDTPVRAEIGLATQDGPRLVPQFHGTTRGLSINSAERTVTLDALDPAERLRNPVTLPLGAEHRSAYYNRRIWPWRNRTNTQWVIDYVLRRNGIYFSPPPRTDCMWAMTGHGGAWPDVGNRGDVTGFPEEPGTPEYVPGRYGLALNGTSKMFAQFLARCVREFRPGHGAGHAFEFHLLAGASNALSSNSSGLLLGMGTSGHQDQFGTTFDILLRANGILTLEVHTQGNKVLTLDGPSLTGEPAWHAVGCWVHWDAEVHDFTAVWHVDGVRHGPYTATIGTLSTYTGGRHATVLGASPVPVQCMQISYAPEIPADWGTPHASQADLDTGLNWIYGLPDVVSADSWEVIRTAVGAEYGVVEFDESGRFRFANRESARRRASAAPVRTLDAAVSLSGLTVSTSLDSVRNAVSASTAPRLQVTSAVTVWEPRTPEQLDTITGQFFVTVQMSRRVQVAQADLHALSPQAWDDDVRHSFVAVDASSGEFADGVIVRVRQFEDESTVQLDITNPHPFTIRFALGDRPTLRINGLEISDEPATDHLWDNPASAQRYGRRTLALQGNAFRQEPGSAAAVARSLLTDLADPTPVLAEIPVPGDPRLQLGDVVTVLDPDGLGGPIRASVIGIRRTLSTADGLSDSLTLRAEPPAP